MSLTKINSIIDDITTIKSDEKLKEIRYSDIESVEMDINPETNENISDNTVEGIDTDLETLSFMEVDNSQQENLSGNIEKALRELSLMEKNKRKRTLPKSFVEYKRLLESRHLSKSYSEPSSLKPKKRTRISKPEKITKK